uniref:Uncharacterized protein n=1 Tax=Arundo donax TaxID=35708 RepID=A0A0A9CG87_ARUDO
MGRHPQRHMHFSVSKYTKQPRGPKN